jgi:hypothetical protein
LASRAAHQEWRAPAGRTVHRPMTGRPGYFSMGGSRGAGGFVELALPRLIKFANKR